MHIPRRLTSGAITPATFGMILCACSTPLHAQATQPTQSEAEESPDGGLEEIIVSARKRDETLIRVPVAVTALSANDINRYAASDLTKIGQLAPQVVIAKAGGGGSGAVFSIRGIGSSTTDSGLSSTVSVNIDGTQVSRGRIITQGFFDLEQVEVLKGPQALFFGKNSPGGVISLRSAGPTKDLRVFVRAGYEFRANERYAEGAVSGPISDTLGFRIAVRGTDMDGWMRTTGAPFTLASNPLNPRLGAADDRSPGTKELLGRATLVWSPTSNFQSTLKVFASTYKDNGPDATSEVKCANPDGKPISIDFTDGSVYQDALGDCRVNARNTNTRLPPNEAAAMTYAGSGAPYMKFQSVLASLTNQWDLDTVKITAVTSFYTFKSQYFENFDFSSIGVQFAGNVIRSKDFSQELRATTNFDGSVNFLVGAFYESESNPFDGSVQLLNIGFDPVTQKYEDWRSYYLSNGHTYSAFGQVNWDIAPNLEFSAGARFTRETRYQLGENPYVKAQFLPLGIVKAPGNFAEGSLANNNVSPEATLTWHPTPSSTIYAAFKTGFKSGGYSQTVVLQPNTTDETLAFKPEKVRGFEIGAKGEFLNNRLRVTAALYRYKFSDLQVQVFDAVTISNQVRNAASARTTGFELDAALAITPDLQVRAAGAINVARYLKYEDAPCYVGQTVSDGCITSDGITGQDLSGRTLHRAPKYNLSGGISYDHSVGPDIRIGGAIDVNYSSGYNAQETLHPVAEQPAYALINANLRVHSEGDKWEFALIGRNLTNKLYITSSIDKPFSVPGQVAVSVSRPREIALQATVRF